MTGFDFVIILSIWCLLFQRMKGKIFPPSHGTSLIITPGSTGRIIWSFDDDIRGFSYRSWTFTPSDGRPRVRLARIIDDGDVHLFATSYEVAVEKPATLILKNVNLTYNGTYRFSLSPGATPSAVVVYIAVSPSVTFNCSSPITVNEGDNVSCACQGQGGNPPADVTWYKDNHKISGTGREEKTLTLNDVDRAASGTYKCVAQSHNLTDDKLIEMIVYFAVPPTVISFNSNPESAVFDELVVITCEALAVPIPSYIIIHNNTEIVSTHKTYIITRLDYSHAGLYKCIATNHLGNSSKIFSLSASATRTTDAPITNNYKREKTATEECNYNETKWYVVVGSILSGIIFGLLLEYILLYARRRWFTNRKSGQHVEPEKTEVDTTYEELDLTKMNAEDNYQSLRVDAAINNVTNEDNLNYTTLSQTRDVENNYQSLT